MSTDESEHRIYREKGLSPVDDILEHFQDALPVQLISIPRHQFRTCYARELVADVKASNTEDYDFLPVLKPWRTGGIAAIIGLLEISTPTSASAVVEEVMRPLCEENLIGADASILDFLRDADQRPCRLIVAGRDITSLVSLSDIQRLPVRAALFAMITHLEMTMADAIRRGYENTEWMTKLPPERMAKIQTEIKGATSDDSFVDSLLFTQFCDKVTIIRKSEAFRDNKNEFSKQMKSIQDLRDLLAHANEFAATRKAAAAVCETVRVIDEWIVRLKLGLGNGA
jgi:hypothetical protein